MDLPCRPTHGQRWPSYQRLSRRQARHAPIHQIGLHLMQTWSLWTPPRHGPPTRISARKNPIYLGDSQKWCHHSSQHSLYQNAGRISGWRALRYSVEGEDSSEDISVYRVERPAEIHIGWQQPSAEFTQMLSEQSTVDFLCVKPDCSWRWWVRSFFADPIEENRASTLPGTERRVTPCSCCNPWCHPSPSR